MGRTQANTLPVTRLGLGPFNFCTMSPASWRSLILSAVSNGVALVFGVSLHFLAIYLRDHGPSGVGWSLQGNGATIVFLPSLIAR